MATQHLCNYCLYKEVPEKYDGCFFKPFNFYKQKPPLGIIPKCIHDEMRLRELRECIANYMQAGFPLLTEWIEEYNELIEKKRL